MPSQKAIAETITEIQSAYPNWNASAETIKVWAKYLASVNVEDAVLSKALEQFISTSKHPFPPTIPEILNIVREIKDRTTPSATEVPEWVKGIKL
ncbi:hypothetical protein JZU46_03645 [bacterium]|jgi:oligoendopeptidase F|nr:hypothetical protein [bacterium]